MEIFGMNLSEIVTTLTFLGGGIFGLMKFYHVFSKLEETMGKVERAVDRLNDHEVRISVLEQQNKTIFESIGGKKHEED